MSGQARYVDGTYLQATHDWHEADAAEKAGYVVEALAAAGATPQSVCDIGCGTGGVLRELAARLPKATKLFGIDISPQAISLAQAHATDIDFRVGGFEALDDPVDAMLLLDVIEHLEDPFALLRQLRTRAGLFVFHIPLDMSAHMILRGTPIMRVRNDVGHLHYFNKDTALATLREAGYEIVYWRYTEHASSGQAAPRKTRLARLPRRVLFRLRSDLAVRAVGGYSMLVAAR